MDEKDYAEAMYAMDRRHDWDYLYRQLAEECAELGHAALKLVRAGKDETPVHIEDASTAYVEELADVYIMIAIARTDLTEKEKALFERMVKFKYARMMKRLGGETTPPALRATSLQQSRLSRGRRDQPGRIQRIPARRCRNPHSEFRCVPDKGRQEIDARPDMKTGIGCVEMGEILGSWGMI